MRIQAWTYTVDGVFLGSAHDIWAAFVVNAGWIQVAVSITMAHVSYAKFAPRLEPYLPADALPGDVLGISQAMVSDSTIPIAYATGNSEGWKWLGAVEGSVSTGWPNYRTN